RVLLRLGRRLLGGDRGGVRIAVAVPRRLPPGAVLEEVHEPVDEESRQGEERDRPDQVSHPQPSIVSASSTFSVLRWRKREIVRWSATAARAGARGMKESDA